MKERKSVPNSYSRQLDADVAASEPVYGYSDLPPPAGHQNAETLNDIKQQNLKKMKVR